MITQHYQKQIDTLEYEEAQRRQGREYIGILGAHMVEILHAYERFTQANKSQGTAEAGSRLSEDKPSTQAAASTPQPYSGPNDSCGTQLPVSGGVPQPPLQTDSPEASMANTVPGDGMQHEDSSAANGPVVELADADSIRQYFHQVGFHSPTRILQADVALADVGHEQDRRFCMMHQPWCVGILCLLCQAQPM